MPAYVLDFQTGHSPERRRYTLDDDRPLRVQLEHVLADLERSGVVLQGGPTDELAVYWAGRELDLTLPPRTLGVTAERPLELRMQRRRPAITLPPPAPEPAPEAFTPRGVYAGAALGLAAGAVAWALTVAIADQTQALATDANQDAAASLAWGVLVGGAVLSGQARRVGVHAGRGASAGVLVGLLAAVCWCALRLALADGGGASAAIVTPGWRVLLWAGLAAVVAGALAGTARTRAVRSTLGPEPTPLGGALGRALGWAGLAGLGAGALGLLPGEVALWQALAAALGGAGVGGAVAWASTFAAPAVLELEARGPLGVGVIALREWGLPNAATVYLRRGAAAAGGAAAVVGEGGRYRLYPDAGSAAARELRHDDRLVLGEARYRFRRRTVA